jgi:hypothetical protein
MAGGIANTTNLANSIKELYDTPFANLRDTNKDFITLLDRKPWKKKTYDTLVRDTYYTPVWTVAEANQTDFVTSTIVATDGLGSTVAYLAPNNHPFLKYSINMKIAYAPVVVNGLTKAAIAGNPGGYVDALKDETEQAMLDFWRALNVQLLATTKAQTNDLDCLGDVLASGAYGGINQASWNPSLDTSTTVLTVSAMQTLFNKLVYGNETLTNSVGATATIREASIKEIWCHITQFTNYLNLVSGQRTFAGVDASMDAGVDDGASNAVTFNGKKFRVIKRFPLAYLVFYGGGMFYAVLTNFDTDDLSSNYTDASFIRMKTYANMGFTGRKTTGAMTALT